MLTPYELRFSDVTWGPDEAKDDSLLADYFVEFPEYCDILPGQKRYIIGRKGTGKSAILTKIRLECKNNPSYHYRDISLRDFPLADFRTLGDRSQQNKSKYVSIWKFLLLTEIAQLITKKESTDSSAALQELKQFVTVNFPGEISIASTVSLLRENGSKVSLNLSTQSFEVNSKTNHNVIGQVHYNRAVKHLEELFQKTHSSSCFILLIDELDEGYKAKDADLNLVILSLLRATDEIYHFFKTININCLPILALRSDIFDSLNDNDLNKLDDYVLRLSWTSDESSPWSLKQIAEKRIEAALRKKYPNLVVEDYWALVANDNSVPKGLWQYLCVLTFSRPRDIVKLLKYCAKATKQDKLDFNCVKACEPEYSKWFAKEFRDEVQSFMSCWNAALMCLAEIGEGKGKISRLEQCLNNNPEVSKWCADNRKTAIDVIKTLFNYSVIGCVNNSGRWIFKYKDEDFEFLPSYPNYCVHYGLCKKLRIPKSYDNVIVERIIDYC